MLRGTGVAPTGMNVDASSYGGPPPPPASGSVRVKRGKPGSSNAPMELEDMSYYDGPSPPPPPPPPPPGAGEIAARFMTGILQQTAMAQQSAQWAFSEAQVAHIMRAHGTEAQKMIIPEAIRPVHHNTLQSMLKKTRAVQPVTPPVPNAIDQVANVDLASAE